MLGALAKEFVKHGYRLKPLVRGILNSHTYQLASIGAVANASGSVKQSPFAADPDRYFTKAAIRMLSAEQILDAISAATGVPGAKRNFRSPDGVYPLDGGFLTGNPAISPVSLWRHEIGGFASPSCDGFALVSR